MFSRCSQYCEYYPEYEKCKQWLERNLPTEFEKVKLGRRFYLQLQILPFNFTYVENFISQVKMRLLNLAAARMKKNVRNEEAKECLKPKRRKMFQSLLQFHEHQEAKRSLLLL